MWKTISYDFFNSLLEAISKMLCHSPFDAPDFVGIAQGEQEP